eukprot:8264629-Lingulodinium_polyedra.AAC.1
MASLRSRRTPSLRAIEAGYQDLRRTLSTNLPAMPWAIPLDILQAADACWGGWLGQGRRAPGVEEK